MENNYISFDRIVNFGVSAKYLKNALNLYRQKKSRSWQNKKDSTDGRKVLINLDSIPAGTRLKYNIPTGKEYRAQQIQEFEVQQEQEKIDRHEAQLREKELAENIEKTALLMAYNDNWVEYYPIYKERYKEARTIQLREKMAKLSAREHAFWLAMIDVSGNQYRSIYGKTAQAFEYYTDLKKELVFSRKISSLNVFSHRLKDLRVAIKQGKSIVEVIANRKSDPRPETTPFKEFHKGLILYYVGHEKKYSYRLCADLVNHHCIEENQPTLSESYIKSVMNPNKDNEFRTLVYSLRNGTKFLNENILPHAQRYPVEFPANLWMIDGTPIQFFCKDKNGRIIRLSLFVILDAFSRKVVGYDVALNEDKFMVMNALKMAVRDEGHLPKEILSDNFSANKTEEIKAIKEQMLKMGVNWRLAKVGNPQDKSQVERFFGVFQSEECALHEDYIGEGITSKRDNRPNSEYLAQATKTVLSVEQMTSRIIKMIGKYNERTKRTRKAPLELYKLPKPKAVEMDSFKIALMFWTRTKHTIKQGMVKITVNKVQHSFEIYSHKLKLQLQGKEVFVRYDANDLESVMLFDIAAENAICECQKSIKVYVESDQPKDNLLKQTAKKKSYKKHIDAEIQTIYDSALEAVGKDEFQPVRPSTLEKNQINEQESKDIIEVHHFDFGITKDVKEPNKIPLGVVKHSQVIENTTYESKVVNKKSLKGGSLKVVKTNDN